MSKGYKNLKVYHKAYLMTLKIYKLTRDYPKEEKYGLTSQMRRASTSIIANIAEGSGKGHIREYIQYISSAIGSSNELEVYIKISNDLHYVNKTDYFKLKLQHEEISKMLFNLRKALNNKKTSI